MLPSVSTSRHPLVKERCGGLPEVELPIELSTNALDVEQRFLEQDQLRLDGHIKSLGGLKERHKELAKFDLSHGLAEQRRAGLPNHGLHLGV